MFGFRNTRIELTKSKRTQCPLNSTATCEEAKDNRAERVAVIENKTKPCAVAHTLVWNMNSVGDEDGDATSDDSSALPAEWDAALHNKLYILRQSVCEASPTLLDSICSAEPRFSEAVNDPIIRPFSYWSESAQARSFLIKREDCLKNTVH